jgi:hypothetical protein
LGSDRCRDAMAAMVVSPKGQLQTQRNRNLNVDGVTINVVSLPQAVSLIVSAARHGDNFSVCTLISVQPINAPDL